jgi:tetratricopeptide (TPR) repeat protein
MDAICNYISTKNWLVEDTLQQAGKELETSGDTEKAISLYEKEVAKGSDDAFPYQRLLIIYHKQKDYKSEMRVLKKGIAVFTALLKEKQQQAFGKKRSRKLVEMSRKIAQKIGLLDKKGEHVLLPEPLNKWTTRKKMVERKLKAADR